MFLSDGDVRELTALRRKLHQRPELSGEEVETAHTVACALASSGPDQSSPVSAGMASLRSMRVLRPGPTVMFRAELDGLPIEEMGDCPIARSAGEGPCLRP